MHTRGFVSLWVVIAGVAALVLAAESGYLIARVSDTHQPQTVADVLAQQPQALAVSETPATNGEATATHAPVSPGTVAAKPAPALASETSAPAAAAHASLDIHAIPLGDGKVSASPKAGYVFSCEQTFRGGGADHAGDWIQGSTWDLTKKIAVQGAVSWPSAWFATSVRDSARSLEGNGLPVGSETGIFPIAASDPAYQYDRNPNSIKESTLSLSLPAQPQLAATPTCVPMGPVGYALNGIAIYNALDDGGRDAVAHEVQDSCDGHPQQAGQYHYHGPSDCMPHAKEHGALIGYALDGFGIYSRFDADGAEYTDADLDECHGTTSPIEWNGKTVTMYHYVLTREYPYTIGCFRGTPTRVQPTGTQAPAQQSAPQSGTPGSPPQAALDACNGKSSGASCSIATPNGTLSGTCRTPPGQTSLACIPQ